MTDLEAKAREIARLVETHFYLDSERSEFEAEVVAALQSARNEGRNEGLEEAARVCSNAGDHDLAAVIMALKGEYGVSPAMAALPEVQSYNEDQAAHLKDKGE